MEVLHFVKPKENKIAIAANQNNNNKHSHNNKYEKKNKKEINNNQNNNKPNNNIKSTTTYTNTPKKPNNNKKATIEHKTSTSTEPNNYSLVIDILPTDRESTPKGKRTLSLQENRNDNHNDNKNVNIEEEEEDTRSNTESNHSNDSGSILSNISPCSMNTSLSSNASVEDAAKIHDFDISYNNQKRNHYNNNNNKLTKYQLKFKYDQLVKQEEEKSAKIVELEKLINKLKQEHFDRENKIKLESNQNVQKYKDKAEDFRQRIFHFKEKAKRKSEKLQGLEDFIISPLRLQLKAAEEELNIIKAQKEELEKNNNSIIEQIKLENEKVLNETKEVYEQKISSMTVSFEKERKEYVEKVNNNDELKEKMQKEWENREQELRQQLEKEYQRKLQEREEELKKRENTLVNKFEEEKKALVQKQNTLARTNESLNKQVLNLESEVKMKQEALETVTKEKEEAIHKLDQLQNEKTKTGTMQRWLELMDQQNKPSGTNLNGLNLWRMVYGNGMCGENKFQYTALLTGIKAALDATSINN
ncbi:hypothetical protein ABK040_001565 [Willaertia magna]